MRQANGYMGGRGGFTLLEILVAMVLIGVLVGALVPSVMSQLGKGEVSRVVEDLDAVGEATKLFRTDVQRWPQSASQLVTEPSSGDADLYRKTIPDRLISRWGGPYLDQGALRGDSLNTALGGAVIANFDTLSWGGNRFLVVKVNEISVDDAKAISQVIDGDTLVRSATADDNGRVRWKAGTSGSTPDTLVYLATSVD
jgi:type II secretion system protein G